MNSSRVIGTLKERIEFGHAVAEELKGFFGEFLAATDGAQFQWDKTSESNNCAAFTIRLKSKPVAHAEERSSLYIIVCADGRADAGASHWTLEDLGWEEDSSSHVLEIDPFLGPEDAAARIISVLMTLPTDGVLQNLRNHVRVLTSPTPSDGTPSLDR